MLSREGFDNWSSLYDQDVLDCYNNKEYPFDGYFDVFDIIFNKINKDDKVLDVGFGTGVLTKKIYDLGSTVYGIDFSEKMVLISKEKMPNGKFYQLDFNDPLPEELSSIKFDKIISTYAFHHLDTKRKISFILELVSMLNPNGELIIGDISFNNNDELESVKESAGDGWDSDEIYIVADEFVKELEKLNLKVNYNQISSCSGILFINKN